MKQKQGLLGLLTAIMLLFLMAACGGSEDAPPTTEGVVATVIPAGSVGSEVPAGGATVVPGGDTAVAPTAVPPQPVVEPTAVPPQPETVNAEAQAVGTQHTVQDREWLYQIARCYGASPQEIATTNNLAHPGWIMAGEVWNIPNVGSVSTPVGAPCLIFYTVVQGDTLISIAERYHIPLDMLVFANYGCYGYNAHYDTWYAPPVAVQHSTTSDYTTGYGGYANGCVYTGYPTIYMGNVLVIPVTPDNVSMRP